MFYIICSIITCSIYSLNAYYHPSEFGSSLPILQRGIKNEFNIKVGKHRPYDFFISHLFTFFFRLFYELIPTKYFK